jgi:hypothetical protein
MNTKIFFTLCLCLAFQLKPGIVFSASDVQRHEFSPLVGFYSGDATRSTVLGGASYNYRYNSSFWMGADFQGGSLKIDGPNGLGIKSGHRFLMADATISWNMPSLLGTSAKDKDPGYAADLYTSAGGGKLWLDSRSTGYGIIGGGLLIHFPIHYLAVKFDLKGIFFSLSDANGSDFNVDSNLSLGPSLLF